MVDTERFADDDGNIKWAEMLAVSLSTVFLGLVTGVIVFIDTLGDGLEVFLGGIETFLDKTVGSIVGMPAEIASGGLGEITEWTPQIAPDWLNIPIPVSQGAVEWLEMFGPLAPAFAVLWWGSIALLMVWGLSKMYDAYVGDSG